MNTFLAQAFARTLALRSGIVLMLLCSLLTIPNLRAQDETQVPLDRDGNIFVITGEMAREYNLFPDYPNLTDARLFQRKDSSFVLELTQMLTGMPQRTRLEMDIWKVLELRNRISDATMMRRVDGELRMSDWQKTSLILGNTLLGFSYGLLASSITQSRSTPFSVASVALPIAFGGSTFWATQQPWFNLVSAQMLESGIVIGALHGVALNFVIGGVRADQTLLAISMAGMSVAEAAGGVFLADKLGWNYGQSSVVTSMGVSGLVSGLGLTYFAGSFAQPQSEAVRTIGAAALLGSGAGWYAGHLLATGNASWANGDGEVFTMPSALGLILPFSIALLNPAISNTSAADGNVLVGASLAAHLGGYALGSLLVKDKDFTLQQGRTIDQFTSIGLLPGMLIGLSISRGDGWRYMPLLSVIGGATGFAIGYAMTAPQAALQAQDNATRRTGQTLLPRETTWLDEFAASDFMRNTDVQFTPLGLAGFAVPGLLPLGASMPILSVRHTFAVPKTAHERGGER